MKKLLATLALVFLASNVSAGEGPINVLTAQEQKDGWKLLFDGKEIKGWRLYKGKDSGTWSAKDGHLVSGKGDLMTAEQYGNFEFSIDFKFEKGNNSGIIYRCQETKGPSYVTGPEFQVMGHKPGATLGKNSGGSLYDMFAPSSNPFKGEKEWTTLKVVCDGNRIQHFVNGVKVVDVVIGSDEWKAAYKISKWKNEAGFAASPAGFIALQDHGDAVLYRNIKLRVLPN